MWDLLNQPSVHRYHSFNKTLSQKLSYKYSSQIIPQFFWASSPPLLHGYSPEYLFIFFNFIPSLFIQKPDTPPHKVHHFAQRIPFLQMGFSDSPQNPCQKALSAQILKWASAQCCVFQWRFVSWFSVDFLLPLLAFRLIVWVKSLFICLICFQSVNFQKIIDWLFRIVIKPQETFFIDRRDLISIMYDAFFDQFQKSTFDNWKSYF